MLGVRNRKTATDGFRILRWTRRSGVSARVCSIGVCSIVVCSIVVHSPYAHAQHDAAADSEIPPETSSSSPAQTASLDDSAQGEAALDERAQRHWGSGMAYLDEGEFDKALEAFQKAYELSGRPRILLGIAVTHEQRGDLQQAVKTLDQYLRLAPTAKNAAAITTHRDELLARYQEQLRLMHEAKRDESKPAPTGSADPVVTHTEGTRSPPAPHPTPTERSPVLKWSALGVGVASGVAATVSGVLAWQTSKDLEETCGSTRSCSQKETEPGRTMALVSTVLTGVAVLGLGVGVWLSLGDEDHPSTDDQLKVGLHYRPSGLTSEVSWRF
jgi:Tetratricopeptide repeat